MSELGEDGSIRNKIHPNLIQVIVKAPFGFAQSSPDNPLLGPSLLLLVLPSFECPSTSSLLATGVTQAESALCVFIQTQPGPAPSLLCLAD